MPSLVARDAFLLALAIPFVRRTVSALAKSPSASARARLQSIIPAFVFSRSCLTSWGSISAITFIEFGVGGRSLVRRKRRPSQFVLECGLRRSPRRSHQQVFEARSESRDWRRRFPELDSRSVPDRHSYQRSQRLECSGVLLHCPRSVREVYQSRPPH